MRKKPVNTDQQLTAELRALKVGHHQEEALTFIKPVNLKATGLTDPEDLEEYMREQLEANDVYNGYCFIYYNEVYEYLNGHRPLQDPRWTDALELAHQYGYDLKDVKDNATLLANILANHNAQMIDGDEIRAAAERLSFILKADIKQQAEYLMEELKKAEK
jgi:hypothetical protein